VIAYPCGSVPEIIRDAENGFVVNSVAEGAEAVSRLAEISRERCREIFEERFSARRMAQEYVALYEQLAQKEPRRLVAADRRAG
jgi:glycosyltransferase involved in cell wall biosynthesis